VEVKLADGSTYPRKGKLLFSDTRVSGSTGTVEAEAEIPNPDGVLLPGQFVRVRLLGAVRPQALEVPARAVLEGPQGKFVYVADGGKAMPRPVQVGDQLADGWVITQGLKAGDPVIVDGMARIFFPGAPIQVGAPAAPPAPAKPAKVAMN
jgi:membrane fusion protein (multidrug efflux system)